MNKAFEKILERLSNIHRVVKTDEDAEWNRAIYKSTEIVREVAEEYNNGWIPCSERLPEECIEVLVSVKEIDGSFYTRTSWVQDGVWVIKKTPLQPTVIAWQPLPEPYKERDKMITYEDECCSCATESYPCMGSACPNRNVPHLYCDKCKDDVEKLYKYEGQEICEDCLLKEFEVIE